MKWLRDRMEANTDGDLNSGLKDEDKVNMQFTQDQDEINKQWLHDQDNANLKWIWDQNNIIRNWYHGQNEAHTEDEDDVDSSEEDGEELNPSSTIMFGKSAFTG